MGKFSNVAHYQDFTELKKILSASAANTYDMDKIEKAYKFAEKAHGDQRRVSGIPYILHPVSVACIVATFENFTHQNTSLNFLIIGADSRSTLPFTGRTEIFEVFIPSEISISLSSLMASSITLILPKDSLLSSM